MIKKLFLSLFREIGPMPYSPDIPRHKGQFLPGPIRDVHARISDSESATTAMILSLGVRVAALEDAATAAKLRDQESARIARTRASLNSAIRWVIFLAFGAAIAAIAVAWSVGLTW